MKLMWILLLFGSLMHHTISTDSPEFGDVRLVGGPSSNEGRVEIYYSSGWGTVCDDDWGITDADVVCKQLGYSWAVGVKREAYYGEGTGDIYLDDVECYGNEDSIFDCVHNGIYNHNCVHGEDTGVICETEDISPEDGLLRLTGDDVDGYSGLLGIMYRGLWGSVCKDGFDMNDANVACKQLGFQWAIDFKVGYRISSSCWSWISDLECNGTESNLLHCGHEGLYEQGCDAYDAVSIACSDGINDVDDFPEYIPVRLKDGYDDSSGRVEVYYEGTWGTVCDKKWNIYDAEVVCRQLGFEGAIEAKKDGFYGVGSGSIHFKSFRCEGNETYLSACTFKYVTDGQCSHTNDAGVVCAEDNDDDDSSYLYSFTEYPDLHSFELTACDNNPCVNGYCYLGTSSYDYHCACYEGWSGDVCDEEIVGCGLDPCLNGGLCESISDNGDYKCDCLYAWIGTHCETERNGCNLYPCLNNGDCIDIDAGGYTCNCMTGYSGGNCEIVETACSSNPCQNGYCLIFPNDNIYFCYCNDGWTGDLCEEEVNVDLECSSSPCLHGECLELSSEGYFCSCEDFWTGVNCETSTIGCVAAPCLNGGSCQDIGPYGDYECTCPAEFEGHDCQTEIACENNPCVNAVACIDNSIGEYTCICETGWIGSNCDEFENVNTNLMQTTRVIDEPTTHASVVTSREPQTSSDLQIGIIAGVGGAALVLIIATIALVCILRNKHSSPKPSLAGVENQAYELRDPPVNAHYDARITKSTAPKVKPKPSKQSNYSNDYEKPSDEYMKPDVKVHQGLSENIYDEIQAPYIGLSQPKSNFYMDILPN
ncbi:deleted in malignant brain tumors 1 protein-like [Anneissia japonica]|uniref:deleted in malignant brain tumors 1 protein-like n=1 Tax=Anneissia japonica TaxID=1529436 RepID=UPI0014259D2B|nr:deleted in malignant brain tumors 1 protein-like [Anneissia japonica]